MNWDAITALTEMTGVIAVVVSVGYLAIQVKKQTEEARLAATRDLAAQTNDMVRELHADPEFLRLYRRGIASIEDLKDDDRLRIGMFFNRLFRIFEQHYAHYLRNRVEYFYSTERRIHEMLTFPGVQKWWELNKDNHEPIFREYVETLLADAKQQGHKSSFELPVVNEENAA